MFLLIEVEVKAHIENLEFFEEQLKNKRYKYKSSLNHEDTYYNMPHGLRDFIESDEALRIRKSIEFSKNDKEIPKKINYYLTYKGKKLDNNTKTRKEIEIKVEDGDTLKELLTIIGFIEVLTIKKERQLYKTLYKNYEIEILIDYIPLLTQYFLEVEIGTELEENIEETKQILFEFLDFFHIKKKDSIRKSYLELVLDKFENN